jgi:hypothetical protein
VPEHSKKLAGFEALYKVDQDKRRSSRETRPQTIPPKLIKPEERPSA